MNPLPCMSTVVAVIQLSTHQRRRSSRWRLPNHPLFLVSDFACLSKKRFDIHHQQTCAQNLPSSRRVHPSLDPLSARKTGKKSDDYLHPFYRRYWPMVAVVNTNGLSSSTIPLRWTVRFLFRVLLNLQQLHRAICEDERKKGFAYRTVSYRFCQFQLLPTCIALDSPVRPRNIGNPVCWRSNRYGS